MNIKVQWLALLLHISQASGSPLSTKTGCPDQGSCGFTQSLQVNSGMVPQIKKDMVLTFFKNFCLSKRTSQTYKLCNVIIHCFKNYANFLEGIIWFLCSSPQAKK
jgi:hypothetical protein